MNYPIQSQNGIKRRIDSKRLVSSLSAVVPKIYVKVTFSDKDMIILHRYDFSQNSAYKACVYKTSNR